MLTSQYREGLDHTSGKWGFRPNWYEALVPDVQLGLSNHISRSLG
jgi:hypothetical protein